jgi:hypothetical protein
VIAMLLNVSETKPKQRPYPGGMISILAVMKTGEQIETAIVGREGVVGVTDEAGRVLFSFKCGAQKGAP